tara:strand:- start:85 stop:528 length:444 start_codon:yes stop_codon:yes gene_type:complete
MYIVSPDYIKLLENYEHYIKLDPVAQEIEGNTKHYKTPRKYPVIMLGDIEIHFSHEKQGSKEAIRKWIDRRERMSENLFVKMDDRDKFTEEIGKRFLQTSFPNKILFVSEKYAETFGGLPNVVITEYRTSGPIGTTLEKLYPVKVSC